MRTLVEELQSTPDGQRLYLQEWTLLGITELISEVMKQKKISCSELSEKLNKSPFYIIKILEDEEELSSFREISDIFWAMGVKLKFDVEPIYVAT